MSGPLSNLYQRRKRSKIGEYAEFNTGYGIPLALRTANQQNSRTAQIGGQLTGDINRGVAESVARDLARINAESSTWAGNQAETINRGAAQFSSGQARRINDRAADFALERSGEANREANRYGYEGAIDNSRELDLFTTLNTAYLNNSIAVPAANEAATQFNQSATQDVLNSQRQMFGSAEEFEAFRDQVNQNLQDKLSGRVSQGTRRQLARQAIASGRTELGDQAVDDFYTGYLGLTSEQLKDQGQNQYQSLYSMYRQSVPITSGAQLLNNYALSNSQASSQAHGASGQLRSMSGISSDRLLGMTGISNQQLYGTNALNASQLYGTNSLQGSQLYGTNSLSNETYFRTNSISGSQAVGLTTMSPAQGIALELEIARMNSQDQGRGGNGGSRYVSPEDAEQGWGYSGAVRSGGPGSGPGQGLRSGSNEWSLQPRTPPRTFMGSRPVTSIGSSPDGGVTITRTAIM